MDQPIFSKNFKNHHNDKMCLANNVEMLVNLYIRDHP